MSNMIMAKEGNERTRGCYPAILLLKRVSVTERCADSHTYCALAHSDSLLEKTKESELAEAAGAGLHLSRRGTGAVAGPLK